MARRRRRRCRRMCPRRADGEVSRQICHLTAPGQRNRFRPGAPRWAGAPYWERTAGGVPVHGAAGQWVQQPSTTVSGNRSEREMSDAQRIPWPITPTPSLLAPVRGVEVVPLDGRCRPRGRHRALPRDVPGLDNLADGRFRARRRGPRRRRRGRDPAARADDRRRRCARLPRARHGPPDHDRRPDPGRRRSRGARRGERRGALRPGRRRGRGRGGHPRPHLRRERTVRAHPRLGHPARGHRAARGAAAHPGADRAPPRGARRGRGTRAHPVPPPAPRSAPPGRAPSHPAPCSTPTGPGSPRPAPRRGPR